MEEDRPEKVTLRKLWAELVEEYAAHMDPVRVPLYLTLSGAEGRDIDALIDRGIIGRTEVGSIRAEDSLKVVAVEASPNAVLSLIKRFPGLKILEQRIEDVLHSTSPLAWPTGDHARYCRACVVNLDLNAPLSCDFLDEQLIIPVMSLIQKFAQLHAVTPRINWTLCLTLHGDILWTHEVSQAMQEFLAENCEHEAAFAQDCRVLLANDLYAQVVQERNVHLAGLEPDAKQRILMAVVPKKIAQAVHAQGWRVTTERNLRYGGREARAPMVTWVLRFQWDLRATTQPQAVYREALRTVFANVGEIGTDGALL